MLRALFQVQDEKNMIGMRNNILERTFIFNESRKRTKKQRTVD